MSYLSLRILILVLFFFFSTAKIVFATAPQITASPSGTINLDQSFTLSATMSGLSKNAVYRLRVALAQPGTTNYFGSTWNGSAWYNGTPVPINYAYFLSITTDATGAWFGDIQAKVDPDDSNFTTGSGTYDVKIGRYTQTGSTATWSDPVSVNVFVPSPSPLPPTPTPTSIPTATPKPPTPTQTKVPTSVPTHTASPTLAPSISEEVASDDAFVDVLGTEDATLDSPTPTVQPKSQQGHPPVIFLFIGSIIVLIAAGTFGWLWYRFKKYGNFFDKND